MIHASEVLRNETFAKLSKLQRLSSSLIYARTSEEIASIIIDQGFDALGAICGDVSLYDPETKKLFVIAKKGYPKLVIHKFDKSVGRAPLLTLEVIQSKKPFYIGNVDVLDEKYAFAQYFIRLTHSRAAVLFPLKIRGDVLGILQFTFKDVQEFNPQEKQFMQNLADQCAQALDKIMALENMRRSKDEMNTVLRGVDDAVIMRNAKGEIIYVNDAAVRLHGCKRPQELLQLNLKEYFHLFSKITDVQGNPLPLDRVPFAEIFQGKSHVKKVYYKVLKKTQEGHWFQITSLPVLDSKGKIECIVSVTHDITEEKQRERTKDEFIGIASHELKTPVTSLKAYTQLLYNRFSKLGEQEVASYLQRMNFQIDKLTNLIHDLLDVTKIQGGKLQFRNELFESNDLVQEIVDELQPTTSEHKILLEKSKDIVIYADRERVGQVITNLLTNAIKYSLKNKPILVKVEKKKNIVLFSVEDFGIGIAKKDQKHIFERFFRETNVKGDTFPGLGLGLYIASEIVKRQRGKIWVESEKGKGSTFYFQLPLAKKN